MRHADAQRLEVDVSVAAKYIASPLDQPDLVAAFPQRAGASMTGVELSNISRPTSALARNRTGFRWSDQQVDMHGCPSASTRAACCRC